MRGRGEGSIYADERGGFRGALKLPDGTRRYVRGATKAEVGRRMAEVRRSFEAGTLGSGKPLTVEQWMGHWLESVAALHVRVRTIEGYRNETRLAILPHLGGMRLDRLAATDVERWHAELIRGGRSAAGVLHAHQVLRAALAVAVRRGRVARNVALLVSPPRHDRPQVQPYTVAEAVTVLEQCAGERLEARWHLALVAGMRQGEVLGLSWPQVDLEAGTVSITQQLQRYRTTGLALCAPKSKASRRVLHLPPETVAALRARRAVQREERLAAGERWWSQWGATDEGRRSWSLVFTTTRGKPIDASMDSKAWHALTRAAGVPGRRLHDARHTAATVALTEGVPMRVVMDTLGHSKMAVTSDVYTHVMDAMRQDASRAVGAALLGAGSKRRAKPSP